MTGLKAFENPLTLRGEKTAGLITLAWAWRPCQCQLIGAFNQAIHVARVLAQEPAGETPALFLHQKLTS